MESTKSKSDFRNYEEGDVIAVVRENYRQMRLHQTLSYAERMQKKYLTFSRPLRIPEAMLLLTDFVDLSDPDINLPNVQHLLQTAEAIRQDGKPDWMQLVGLIHDLGKVMYQWGSDEDGTSLSAQWGMVGDIFLLGCRIPETVVYPEFNSLNPDMQDPRYNTETGIYEPNCGIDQCVKAWGHDEYLYQVLSHHPENRLPEAGMVMIRYHSFYPWHSEGSYAELADERDAQYKDWVREFNQYDLYTKSPQTYDFEEAMEHYLPIIEKYLGSGPIYF